MIATESAPPSLDRRPSFNLKRLIALISSTDWAFAALLLVVSLISFRLGFGYRGPIDEEAQFLDWIATGKLTWGLIDLRIQPYRPLHFMMIGALYHLFGLDFHRYFLLMPLLHWLNALIYWRILHRLLPAHRWLTMSAALLFLVYPGDPTRTIIGMAGHTFSLLMLLLAAWILLRLAAGRLSVRWIAVMSIALIASMLAYDQMVPLAGFVPLLLLVYPARGITRQKSWLAAAWWLMMIAYTLFRLYFIFFTPLGLHRFTAGASPSQNAADYLSLLSGWYQMGLVDVWYWALRRLRPAIALFSPEVRTLPLRIVFGIPLALLFSGWALIRRWLRDDNRLVNTSGSYLLYAALLGVGLAIALVSYLVVPLAYTPLPTTDLFQNRHHMPAGLGFGLFVAAFVFMIAQVLTDSTKRLLRIRRAAYPYIGWVAVSMLAAISVLWQITRSQYWQQDWEFKAAIWRGVAENIPDIEPGSAIILHLADDDIHPAALRGATTITGMLHFLYDDYSLQGDMISLHRWVTSTVRFYDDYLTIRDQPYPYDRVVFLTFTSVETTGQMVSIQAHVIPCAPDEFIPEDIARPVCGNPVRIAPDGEVTVYAHDWLYGD